MNESEMAIMEGGETSSVQLRLNSKGLYTWTIYLKIMEGVGPAQAVNQLREIDEQLQQTFPNHAKKGSGRMVGFNS